ncbi:MAG: hypothetical protein ACKVJC_00675 [Flavobacteriales bacterium]
MTTENTFISKEDKEKKVKKKNTSKTKSSKKAEKESTVSLIINRFNKKKIKSSIGIGLILLSFFLMVANFSYLLTWQEDQSRILGKGLFELLFDLYLVLKHFLTPVYYR